MHAVYLCVMVTQKQDLLRVCQRLNITIDTDSESVAIQAYLMYKHLTGSNDCGSQACFQTVRTVTITLLRVNGSVLLSRCSNLPWNFWHIQCQSTAILWNLMKEFLVVSNKSSKRLPNTPVARSNECLYLPVPRLKTYSRSQGPHSDET